MVTLSRNVQVSYAVEELNLMAKMLVIFHTTLHFPIELKANHVHYSDNVSESELCLPVC